VARVAQQPLIRVDRNDYSVDPMFAGRRIEVRVSQREITAGNDMRSMSSSVPCPSTTL
jgi:hypothetical protein